MVIVDTSVWIDYLKDVSTPQTEWLEAALGQRAIGITSLNLCEVLQGARSDAEFLDIAEEMLKLAVFEIGRSRLAVAAAHNFSTLRRRGITVRSTIDCMLATFCIENGYRLLHKDRDFDAFESHLGLLVVKTGDMN